MPDTILEIVDLRTYYHDRKTVLKAVDGVNLTLERGSVLGVVGESGCGKSTLALSILNLVPHPGYIDSGRVLFQGQNILEMSAVGPAQRPRPPDIDDLPGPGRGPEPRPFGGPAGGRDHHNPHRHGQR